MITVLPGVGTLAGAIPSLVAVLAITGLTAIGFMAFAGVQP